MVPKQSGFNQSDTTSVYCARTSCCFPGSSAMGRDGEVKQRQHFFITETQFAIQNQVM